MPKLSSKRQITLPVDQCKELGIEPGDELACFIESGQLTLVKKSIGKAKGVLTNVSGDRRYSDEQSRDNVLE